ncbi:hypothetical protein V492_07352 [Pseudogymnoascus sp. VKM F-4246]|nr:hypothetical protein V492_07352 [Pseudogymnoascus sp. VKM F-4246]
MPLVNKSTFPRLQKLAIAAVGDNYNDGWIPSEIAAGSPTLPSQVIILLDPTDQIARDFDGQLRKFEITLPYHWANELEDKMGRNIKVAIILGGPAFCHKFWRTVPEGLDGRGELGYWILGGLRAPIGRGGYRA